MLRVNAFTTVDYEIFGDGSGSIHDTLVAKTDVLLDLFQQTGVTATFFIEIEEIYRFRTDRFDGWELVEKQLSRIMAGGHEIALHVHPQWVKAVYDDEAGQYLVDDDAWQMHKVFHGPALTEYLTIRRQMLVDLLSDLGHSVNIVGFRAGGYNLGDPATNAEFIRAAGLLYDASVVSGATSVGSYSEYDYSSYTRPEVYTSQAGDFASLPISSCSYNKAAYITPAMLRRGAKPKLRVSKAVKRTSRLAKLGNILKIKKGPMDFVLLPTWLFALAALTSRRAGYVQVVGHNKSILSNRRVQKNLRFLARFFDTSHTLNSEHERQVSRNKGHTHGL